MNIKVFHTKKTIRTFCIRPFFPIVARKENMNRLCTPTSFDDSFLSESMFSGADSSSIVTESIGGSTATQSFNSSSRARGPIRYSGSQQWRELLIIPGQADDDDDDGDYSTEWVQSPSRITIVQEDAPKFSTTAIDYYHSSANHNNHRSIIGLHKVVVNRKDLESTAAGIGIYFTRENSDSPLRIGEISSDGPFAASSLHPGMVVVAINDIYMAWNSPEDAIEEILCSGERKIYLTAGECQDKPYRRSYTMNVRSTVENWRGDYGVTFERKYVDSPLYIKSVAKDGPFPTSSLLPGMIVLAINGRHVEWESPATALQELNSIRSGYARLTVEAVVASVDIKAEPISIGVKESSSSPSPFYKVVGGGGGGGEKKVRITKVPPKSIANTTIDLQVGMEVLVLDGNLCPVPLATVYSILEGVHHRGSSSGVEDTTIKLIAVDLDCKKIDHVNRLDVDEERGEEEEGEYINYTNHHEGRSSSWRHGSTATRDVVSLQKVVVGGGGGGQLQQQQASIANMEESVRLALRQCLLPSCDEDIDRNTYLYLEDNDDHFNHDHQVQQKNHRSNKNNNQKKQSTFAMTTTTSKRRSDEDYYEDNNNDDDDDEEEEERVFRINKDSANEDVGLSLRLGDRNGGIYISGISEYSKFNSTKLQVGMRIVEINGLICPNSMRVTTALINGSGEGPFEIVTTYKKKSRQRSRHEIFFTEY